MKRTAHRTNEIASLYQAFSNFKMGFPIVAKFGSQCPITGNPIARGEQIRMLEGKAISQSGVEVLSIIERSGQANAVFGDTLEDTDLVEGKWYMAVSQHAQVAHYQVIGGKLSRNGTVRGGQSLAAFTSRAKPLLIVMRTY